MLASFCDDAIDVLMIDVISDRTELIFSFSRPVGIGYT